MYYLVDRDEEIVLFFFLIPQVQNKKKKSLFIFLISPKSHLKGVPGGSVVKNHLASAEDSTRTGYSIPGSGRFTAGGNGNPLQYSCLENPMGRGAWQATVHGVTKSWTWLSN